MRLTREQKFKILWEYASYFQWEGCPGTEDQLKGFEDCLKCIYNEKQLEELRKEAKLLFPKEGD
jgi:hypothetical protein